MVCKFNICICIHILRYIYIYIDTIFPYPLERSDHQGHGYILPLGVHHGFINDVAGSNSWEGWDDMEFRGQGSTPDVWRHFIYGHIYETPWKMWDSPRQLVKDFSHRSMRRFKMRGRSENHLKTSWFEIPNLNIMWKSLILGCSFSTCWSYEGFKSISKLQLYPKDLLLCSISSSTLSLLP